jgi:uncharacterized protein (DUF1778 family)
MLAERAASLRLREYFGAEDFAGPHYHPDHPGELVGQRHRDEACRLFRSVSDFVVAAAREAAARTIEETQIIRLSVEDQRAFAEAILNPPPPAPALLRAAEVYRSLIKEPK